MAKKIKDPTVFDVEKHIKSITHGPKRRPKGKTMTVTQMKFPWYNEKV